MEKYFRSENGKAEKAMTFSAMFLLYLAQKKELQQLPDLSRLTFLPADLSGSIGAMFLLNGKIYITHTRPRILANTFRC